MNKRGSSNGNHICATEALQKSGVVSCGTATFIPGQYSTMFSTQFCPDQGNRGRKAC